MEGGRASVATSMSFFCRTVEGGLHEPRGISVTPLLSFFILRLYLCYHNASSSDEAVRNVVDDGGPNVYEVLPGPTESQIIITCATIFP